MTISATEPSISAARSTPAPAPGPLAGLAARRAVARWSLRLYRREWRQQALILGLLAVAVTASVFASIAGYNLAAGSEGRFGSADERLNLQVLPGPGAADAVGRTLSAARHRFGTVDLLGRRSIDVPGSTDTVELRAQDPRGPYGAPMLRLRQGRYPSAPDEVALTDGAAALLAGDGNLHVGRAIDVGGVRLRVVGRVENPADLGDDFALTAPLARTGGEVAGQAPDSLVLLVRTTGGHPGFQPPAGVAGGVVEGRGDSGRTAAAVAILATTTLALLLVSLVAAAGFVVVAQRRLRQLGMMAAVGATPRQVRLVTVVNGAALGTAAAVVGTGTGLVAWFLAAPTLAGPAGHRIDRWAVPWMLVAASGLLAILAATAAAWWPARTLSRVSVTDALAARPPRPRPARHSAVAAIVLLAAGLLLVSSSVDPADDRGNALIVPGIVALVLGLLLVAPAVVRVLGLFARRMPVGVRLAWRDLARHRARSSAALAATSLGLAIAATVIIVAAAQQPKPGEGNLSDREVLFRFDPGSQVPDPRLYVPTTTPRELAADRAAVERFAATLGGAAAVPLEVAVDARGNGAGRSAVGADPALVLGTPVGPHTTRDAGLIYVATPALLDHLHVDRRLADRAGAILLTTQRGPVSITGDLAKAAPRQPAADGSVAPGPVDASQVIHIHVPRYGSAPHTLITPSAVAAGGWTSRPAGWLVEAARPLSGGEVAAARRVAAGAGMTVEARHGAAGRTTLRTTTTALGILLALGILAMTVGLIQAEAARDFRTLTAVGAPPSLRRSVTASTAGGLALLAAVVGTTTAAVTLVAAYWPHPSRLTTNAPIVDLLAIVVGLPLLASAAGWLLGGREPAQLRRAPAD